MQATPQSSTPAPANGPARHRRRFRGPVPGLLASAAAPAGPATALTGGANAAENPHERGPAPTEASVTATRAAYAVSGTRVSRFRVSGFGGGTIHHPTSTGDGTFDAVAITPGITARQSSNAWLGPRLASQGFVVSTIDTNTTSDQPASRGDQLPAALDHLTKTSSAGSRADSTRLEGVGHSTGGTLEAAKGRPPLKAAIALTAWNPDKSWPEIRTPALVVGADGDGVAPARSHSEPFYESLPSSLDRAYLKPNDTGHFTPNAPNTTIAKYSISWLKRFIDNDARYEQFLGPPPQPSSSIAEYRGNRPHAA
ncbi:alpha/beta hydrolase [Streptomyces sp. NEAU-W12]|uniref:poly(ethylene terephthalate) hydrolase family protein n=1 Tax=Streptomyces sp. NEAU-W12 TaxID=2994668 RepID=UPI00224A7211|nr:alpha/beta hydrolase [Streptomyces sp. NEAU-W12]MCX2923356.1 alpha/beta hydrolase [Streptomyces sp. NEAU-W12]